MTTTATTQFSGLALGDSTLVEASAELRVTNGKAISTAGVDTTITAAASDDSGAFAMTGIESFTYSEDEDGSEVGVWTSTSGTAEGDTAYVTSTTSSFAIDTEKGADVAFGMSYSFASGDEYEDAYAWTEPYGDITAGGGMDTDTALFSRALGVGIAVDVA